MSQDRAHLICISSHNFILVSHCTYKCQKGGAEGLGTFKVKQSSQQITYSQPSKHTEATAGKRDHRYGSVAATKVVVMIGTENR
jgi:hypothetical protein